MNWCKVDLSINIYDIACTLIFESSGICFKEILSGNFGKKSIKNNGKSSLLISNFSFFSKLFFIIYTPCIIVDLQFHQSCCKMDDPKHTIPNLDNE